MWTAPQVSLGDLVQFTQIGQMVTVNIIGQWSVIQFRSQATHNHISHYYLTAPLVWFHRHRDCLTIRGTELAVSCYLGFISWPCLTQIFLSCRVTHLKDFTFSSQSSFSYLKVFTFTSKSVHFFYLGEISVISILLQNGPSTFTCGFALSRIGVVSV